MNVATAHDSIATTPHPSTCCSRTTSITLFVRDAQLPSQTHALALPRLATSTPRVPFSAQLLRHYGCVATTTCPNSTGAANDMDRGIALSRRADQTLAYKGTAPRPPPLCHRFTRDPLTSRTSVESISTCVHVVLVPLLHLRFPYLLLLSVSLLAAFLWSLGCLL